MFYKSIFRRFFVGVLFLTGLSCAIAHEFLEVQDAFPVDIHVKKQEVVFTFNIADGYYLYKERFNFKINQQKVEPKDISFPTPETKFDPNFNQTLQIFHGKTDITLHAPTPLKETDKITFQIQGCAQAGLCYPPESIEFKVSDHQKTGLPPIIDSLKVDLTQATQTTHLQPHQPLSQFTKDPGNSNISEDLTIAQKIEQAPLWKIIFLCLGLGVLLSLTPCVLPMLPILLRILVGQNNAEHHRSKSHTFKLSVAYVFGMSIVYTLLGILSASIGASLSLWLQNPYVLIGFGVLLLIFSLSMFDVFQLQMPLCIQNKINQYSSNFSGGGYGHSLIMGMLSALICGPCIAAPLAGVLLFIAQSGQIITGAVALFSLAWGQGLILLLLGLGASNLIPKAGEWMNAIKVFCGLLLIATALWIMRPALPDPLALGLWAVLLIMTAYFLGLFDPIQKSLLTVLGKALGLMSLIWAILLIIGLALGASSILNPLEKLEANPYKGTQTEKPLRIHFETIHHIDELKKIVSESTKPILLKLSADWCIACHELEQNTFSDPQVQKELQHFKRIELDMSQTTPEHKVFLKQFNLFGPPALLFFHQGQLTPYRRIIGYVDAQTFLNP